MPGPIALVGSGEFTPATEDVDTTLLDGRDQSVVFLPTAAAREGDERISYWVNLGLDHYKRLGVRATPLLVLDRQDADDDTMAAQVAGAGLVYLSGGDPGHLARTLVGSRVGSAIHDAWRHGTAVAGCSAGAMALMETVPDIRRRRGQPIPGLALVRAMTVIPHFDQIERWAPGATRLAVDAAPQGSHVVGVDEDTAIVGGPVRWKVMGRGSTWLLRRDQEPVRVDSGAQLSLD